MKNYRKQQNAADLPFRAVKTASASIVYYASKSPRFIIGITRQGNPSRSPSNWRTRSAIAKRENSTFEGDRARSICSHARDSRTLDKDVCIVIIGIPHRCRQCRYWIIARNGNALRRWLSLVAPAVLESSHEYCTVQSGLRSYRTQQDDSDENGCGPALDPKALGKPLLAPKLGWRVVGNEERCETARVLSLSDGLNFVAYVVIASQGEMRGERGAVTRQGKFCFSQRR